MKQRKPEYYDSFRCIASACSDTCCAGWEIEVDEQSAARYLSMPGEIGERVRRELKITEEESYFALKHGKCPFLQETGLCDLICEAGEESLCDICREHPRFYNWYGADTEIGLGLCCEEAERLLFSSSEPARFVEEVLEEETTEQMDEETVFLEQMKQTRECIFSILQDRTRPLADRLEFLLQYTVCLQEVLDTGDGMVPEAFFSPDLFAASKWHQEWKTQKNVFASFEAQAVLEAIQAQYLQLECLDRRWFQALEHAKAQIEQVLASAKAFSEQIPDCEWEYEHLAVYFINRYYMEAVYDMDVYSKAVFCVVSLLMIRTVEINRWCMEKERSEKDRDAVVRMYSKEIEYCPENVAALVDCCWEQEAFSWKALITITGALL